MASKPNDPLQSPAHLLRRCQQVAFELYAEEAGKDALTPRQHTVLSAVDRNEGASQTELVRLTGIDRSTLADMISRLIARDLLARKRTEADQRANAVRLTAKGSKALKGVQGAAARADQRLLDLLPAGRRGDFLRMLTTIAASSASLEEPAAKPKGRAKGKKGKEKKAKKSGR